ncbi:MAG: DUF4236 domain-containing protein [Armatimonadetes bacterium]|nr:DUF4236 domain-containing protein [Armatimonadota bacterium]
MGFRFRKSIRIAKGVRLNVGTKSLGISAGVKGARISTNTRTGTRATVSAPGTGLSYSTKIGGAPSRTRRTSALLAAPALQSPSRPLHALETGEVHYVQMNGNTMLWPWLCACCGQKFPGEAPIGSQQVAPDVHAIKTAVSTFAPSYCPDCATHQELWTRAQTLPHSASQSGTLMTVGCVLFGVIGPLITLMLLAVHMPFWAAFLIPFLMCVAVQVSASQNAKAQEEAARIERARVLRDLNADIEKTRGPRCTCSGPAVWLDLSHGSLRRFAFRNASLSRAFATLNAKKVVY